MKLWTVLSLLPLSIAFSASAAEHYLLTDLGPLPDGFNGSVGAGYSLTFSGFVAGDHWDGDNIAARAIAGNGFVLVGTLGGVWSHGVCVNELGHIGGYSDINGSSYHAFVWDGDAMLDIGTLGGLTSAAMDINSLGQATGESLTETGARHAFFYNGSEMTDLFLEVIS